MNAVYGETPSEKFLREEKERSDANYLTTKECRRQQRAGKLVKLVRDVHGTLSIVPLEDWERWNPQYIAYAQAHGRTPEEMLAYDKSPGRAHMHEFTSWNDRHWKEFEKSHPWYYPYGLHVCSDCGHHAYTAWLLAKYPPKVVNA